MHCEEPKSSCLLHHKLPNFRPQSNSYLKLLELLDGGVGGGPRLLELAPVLRLEPLLLGPVTLLLRLLELKWNKGIKSDPTI